MTEEGKRDTEKWVEAKRARYPYGYDPKGKVRRLFEAPGFPHAILIDPQGVVVWKGHPGTLSKALVEKHLAGALEQPLWSWPASAKKVRVAVQKGQLGKALEEARALGAEGEPLVGQLERFVAAKVASLEADVEAGDWLAVDERGKRFLSELDGLPALERVKAARAKLESDEKARAVLDAQREVRKLMAGKIKKADHARIEKKLAAIRADLPGTAAARDAEAASQRLVGQR